MKPQSLKSRSGGFTLIELMVVIAIIGILGALAAGAVIRVRGSQEQKATEVAVAKLGSALDMQIKASMDMVREMAIPQTVLDAADQDKPRARAIMSKIRIRGDFPQNVTEAKTGVSVLGYTIPASQTYVKKLANYAGGGTADEESAICLHMILNQHRRGVMFNADEAMGSGGIGEVLGMPVFVDRFGSPIGFRRWANPNDAIEGTILNELNINGDVTPNPARKDPFDPEGRFLTWTNSASRNLINAGLGTFPTPTTAVDYLTNNNFSPFVYSVGRDKTLSGSDGDDTYSFRLRKSGQRGGN